MSQGSLFDLLSQIWTNVSITYFLNKICDLAGLKRVLQVWLSEHMENWAKWQKSQYRVLKTQV